LNTKPGANWKPGQITQMALTLSQRENGGRRRPLPAIGGVFCAEAVLDQNPSLSYSAATALHKN